MPDPLSPKRPTTSDDFAAAIRTAADAGAQVQFTGSNSLPLTHFAADRPIQPISTLRLNKILHHAVADMTVTVQAGITLEALQRQLAWHNQWLPVDPPVIAPPLPLPTQAPGLYSLGSSRTPGSRTLAGLIATNSLGPLRFHMAGVNDWRLLILGIRWIDAQGTLLKGGGQTVKNVAGYSMPRMLIGSCGGLGAIAEITLRTFARPQDERCILFFCDNPARAEELLAAIFLAPTAPAYVQVIGSRTCAANPLQLPSPATGAAGLVVAAGFLGRTETCQAQIETLRSLAPAKPLESISQTAAQAGRLRLWMTTEPPIPANAPQAVGFRIHVKPSQVAGVVASLETQDANAWVVAEAQGIVRGMSPSGQMPTLPTDALVLRTQGTHLPPAIGPSQQRLKRSLDPSDIFGLPLIS